MNLSHFIGTTIWIEGNVDAMTGGRRLHLADSVSESLAQWKPIVLFSGDMVRVTFDTFLVITRPTGTQRPGTGQRGTTMLQEAVIEKVLGCLHPYEAERCTCMCHDAQRGVIIHSQACCSACPQCGFRIADR